MSDFFLIVKRFNLNMKLETVAVSVQVVASCILLVERLTCRKKDFALCHKYNAAIGCIVIVIIIVNILATVFGEPDKDDCTPGL